MRLAISFGALVPKLHLQITVPQRRLQYLQDAADGITLLSIGGLLSESETYRARRRLLKRIMTTFPEARNRTSTDKGTPGAQDKGLDDGE